MIKSDLHIHTYCSDGELSPEQVVRRFAGLGYQRIAITDHDGTRGVIPAVKEGKKLGIQVIPGVEMTTGFFPKGRDLQLWQQVPEASEILKGEKPLEIHMLGYCMDMADMEFISANEDSMRYRRERNQRIFKILEEMGTPIDPEDVKKNGSGEFAGKPDFVRAFEKNGIYFDDPWEFMSQVKRQLIPTERGVKVIKGAGGIAVLAHPKKIRGIGPDSPGFFQRVQLIINRLKPLGLEGLECWHPSASAEESEILVDIAKKSGLIITRGSDFHREN